MLDLTGLPALDLAIGLALIYFLLSTLAATIQEFIAAILGLRARTLEQGLRSLLEDRDKGWEYVDDFYDHPLIRSLYRTPPPAKAKPVVRVEDGRNAALQTRGPFKRALGFFKRTKGPSYVSPRSFALVVLDNFAPGEGKKTFFEHGGEALDAFPPELAARFKPLVAGAEREVETVRTNLEAFYDDTMARVSGWYKRKTQIILIVIGIALVPAINANTIKMGERMWKDDTVRSAVVAQAQAVASATPTPTPTPTGTATPGTQALSESAQRLNTAAEDADDVVKVGIPMGWRGEAVPRGTGEIFMAIGGWALTILAISLGAPFWFDALSRLSRLRSSGKPETPLPASGSGKQNERILTPPQVPTENVQYDEPSSGAPAPSAGQERPAS